MTGCSAPPAADPSITLAPTAAASAYTCDDIAALEDVANVFIGADGAVPTPIAATQPATTLTDHAVPVIGGLSCSWRVGLPADNLLYTAALPDSNWPYLTVRVLPGAAASWTPNVLQNEPVDARTSVGSIEAAAACGSQECFISAPVGTAWIEIAMSLSWFETFGWISAGWSTDTVLAQMQPLATSVFTVVTDAVPGQLVWPAVAIVDSSDPMYRNFDSYVASSAGLVDCALVADGRGLAITVGDGLAGVVDAMASVTDTDTAMTPIVLQGAIDGERPA